MREIDRAFKKARRKCGDLWKADADCLSTFLKATDSSSPPERLFLIQLYRAAGRQLTSATTIPADSSEWFVEITPPKETRRLLQKLRTQMWLEIYAQRSVRVTGHPGSDGFTCHPDFLVEVQVNDAQCSHVNVKRTPLRVAVEVDGKRFHYDSERQIERDTERHNGLTASGIVPLRCNAWQINETERSGKLEVGARMLDRLMDIAEREVLGPAVQVDSGDRAAVRRG